MGKIWLETSSGKLIHLPVQGDDFNSPDDDIRIPATIMINKNRCYSQPITVSIPGRGTVTIDFMQDSGLTGSCNQCGMCCGHPAGDCQWGSLEACGYVLNADINWHVCQHLVISNWHKWGAKNNTSCAIYADLINIFKGCIYPPLHMKPWMTGCGYSVI